MEPELRDLIFDGLDGLEEGLEEITSVEAILLQEDPDRTAEIPAAQLAQLTELCRSAFFCTSG